MITSEINFNLTPTIKIFDIVILTSLVPSFRNVTLRLLKYDGVQYNVSVMEAMA